MSRYMPSGAQLPTVWNKDMDRFICYCEALGDVDTRTMVKGLKQKFPALKGYVINPESIERRIMMLEQMENDYFVLGMETAVAQSEAAGFPVPPMDLEQYAPKPDAQVEATEPATLTGDAGSPSEATTVGHDEAQTEGEGLAQGPSANVLAGDKTKEKEKSVESPAVDPSGPKSGLKAGIKARLGMGKENIPGSSSSGSNEQELQIRGGPSVRPNGS